MDWSYIAGLFDGEGCVCFVRRRNHIEPRFSMSNSYRPVLEQVKNFTSMGGIYANGNEKKNPNWTPCFYWAIASHQDCLSFAAKIFPYLIIKKEKVKQSIDYLEKYKVMGTALYNLRKTITKEELQKLYDNSDVRPLAKQLDISTTSLWRLLKEKGVKCRGQGHLIKPRQRDGKGRFLGRPC